MVVRLSCMLVIDYIVELLSMIIVYLIAGLGTLLLLYYFERLSLDYRVMIDVEM